MGTHGWGVGGVLANFTFKIAPYLGHFAFINTLAYDKMAKL
jgi:hypothetical protein